MDRRSFLAATVATLATKPSLHAQLGGGAPANGHPLLKTLMAKCGGLVGTQAERHVLDQNSALSTYIRQNASIITPGNDMKWSVIRPSENAFNFDNADWVVAFCQRNDIAVHGHNLCWESENPGWLNAPRSREDGIQLLTQHIKTVAGRYRGKIDSWDVVNEPIAVWYNNPGGLREGPWFKSIGPEYIDIAFHAAAEADPGAIRVMNLNHVEQVELGIEKFRQKTLDLINGMVARRVPVQAIGFESHISVQRETDIGPLTSFIKSIKQMGLQIMITEMDVLDNGTPGDISSRDAAVAKAYGDYLSFMLSVAEPKRIIFWSLNDRGNWLDHLPSLNRADQLPHRPGLLDNDLLPKPSLDAVEHALRGCRR